MEDEAVFYKRAEGWLERLLELYPVAATQLGDHRWDDRLADYTPEALASILLDGEAGYSGLGGGLSRGASGCVAARDPRRDPELRQPSASLDASAAVGRAGCLKLDSSGAGSVQWDGDGAALSNPRASLRGTKLAPASSVGRSAYFPVAVRGRKAE